MGDAACALIIDWQRTPLQQDVKWLGTHNNNSCEDHQPHSSITVFDRALHILLISKSPTRQIDSIYVIILTQMNSDWLLLRIYLKTDASDDVTVHNFCFFASLLKYINQMDSMLSWVCTVIDHWRHQNMVKTSLTHSAILQCASFLFLPNFDISCDLL